MKFKKKSPDIVIIGGAGHIGLPLGLLLADKGKSIVLLDRDKKNVNKINNLKMPFMEDGGGRLLKKNKDKIFATADSSFIKYAKTIIVCIDTPVKNSRPDLTSFFKMFKEIKNQLNPRKLLIIRSSIYPGTAKNKKNIRKKF